MEKTYPISLPDNIEIEIRLSISKILTSIVITKINKTHLSINLEFIQSIYNHINSDDLNELEYISICFSNITFTSVTISSLGDYRVDFDQVSILDDINISGDNHFISLKNSEINQITIDDFTTTFLNFYDNKINELNISNSYMKNFYFDRIKINSVDIFSSNFTSAYISNCTFKSSVYFDFVDIYKSLNITNCHFYLPPSIYFENESFDFCTADTLRTLKQIHESQLNKIQANKFFALELNKTKLDLQSEIHKVISLKNYKTRKEGYYAKPVDLSKIIPQWIILLIHDSTSRYSQNWFLPLYWILIIGLFGSTLISHMSGLTLATTTLLTIIAFLFIDNQKDIIKGTPHFILLVIMVTSYLIFNGSNLNIIATYLANSYKLNGSELGGFHYVINKAVIAYLTYQFILGVRKDTRR